MTPSPNEPQASGELEEALNNLEQEAVDWHEECERDKKEHGYPLGDAKELRRARRNVMNLIASATKANTVRVLDEISRELPREPKANPSDTEFWRGDWNGYTRATREFKAIIASKRKEVEK